MSIRRVDRSITIIMLGWSIVYALYMTLVSLLVMGPHDFNGHPNPVSANVVGALFLAASTSQAIMAGILSKQRLMKPFKLALLVAAGACITGVIGVGHNFISVINPVIINLALLLCLFGIQLYLYHSEAEQTQK